MSLHLAPKSSRDLCVKKEFADINS